MRSVLRALRREQRHTPRSQPASRHLRVDGLEDRATPSTGSGFTETALVSNVPGLAENRDRNLINPWGFTETAGGQFRVSANGAGRGILFNAEGEKSGADIRIPPPAGSPAGTTSTPNGVVTNDTSDFVITVNGRSAPATLLFSTEDGTIAGWNPRLSQTRAVIGADESGNGAVYKLLTLGTVNGANYIYASNFHNGTVDVFDKNFAPHTFSTGQFTDPNAPAGFAPFGIKNVDGTLFVTFAKQDADKHDVAGPGNGFIDEFTSDGQFIKRFASGTAAGGTLTALNSPIGATFAPAGFGNFGGDLLIGNFGDSHVSAFDPTTGAFLGQLTDTHGQPLILDAGITGPDGNTKALWGIGFGNGHGGAGTQTMFFAAGPNDETDGVFGAVNVAGAGMGDQGDQGNGQGDQDDQDKVSHHGNGSVRHLQTEIAHDVKGIGKDLTTIGKALATNTDATVTADLAALNTSFSNVMTDVSTNVSATTDLNATMAAEAQLAAAVGANVKPGVSHRLHDVSTDLADLATELARLTSLQSGG